MPHLIGRSSGGLVCESVCKADLLSDHFDSKQSRESVDLRSITIALLSNEAFTCAQSSLLYCRIALVSILCVSHTLQSALESEQ